MKSLLNSKNLLLIVGVARPSSIANPSSSWASITSISASCNATISSSIRLVGAAYVSDIDIWGVWSINIGYNMKIFLEVVLEVVLKTWGIWVFKYHFKRVYKFVCWMFGDQRSSNSDRVPYKTHPTEQLTINATENWRRETRWASEIQWFYLSQPEGKKQTLDPRDFVKMVRLILYHLRISLQTSWVINWAVENRWRMRFNGSNFSFKFMTRRIDKKWTMFTHEIF